jgi:GDP/UDP-N,N'-diacetylbacillosamine 2-epimerase (hydrolysing)
MGSGRRTKKRRVGVVTGTRAEYGIYRPVLEAIRKQPQLELQLFVTGMHLLRQFGYTVREIEQDCWSITGRVRLQGEKDDAVGQSRGLGRAITGLTNHFARLKTDIVLVMGDRIEAFAGAAAATASQLVLGHIHGGDIAEGIQDEAYRHAISKLAHVHFPASKGSKERLIRLGEEKFRIYQTGSPAVDNLSKMICRDKEELSRGAGFDVGEDFAVVLQHPAGGTVHQEEKRMAQTLRAIGDKGLQVLVLYPNSDPGFSGIVRAAKRFSKREGYRLLKHVPREVYMGLLERSRVLVGNSSSGLIEASRLNVDVVNVGSRQRGRERGSNVVDAAYGAATEKAITALLRTKRPARRRAERIYGDGKSSEKIASILARIRLDGRLKQKRIAY